jgi:diguanylate cyclase (GGDEF)-like protein/PAS domain S-box-containing protein
MPNRIMLVEDESIVAMDVQQRLVQLGYQVVAHAISGEQAIRLAGEVHPDLILMDIKLRGSVDGIEAARQIRNDRETPIIYLTAFADDNTIKRASLTQAYGYLIKPFEDRELHSAIEVALYKHIMESRLRETEERYALATRAANDGIWDWNLSTDEVYYSARWKAMLGCEEQEIGDRISEWFDRVHPDDFERLQLAVDRHLKHAAPTLECEYRIVHKDQSFHWMLCRGMALFDREGRAYRLAGSQSDITSRKAMEDQLMHKALHDELTGLPNRALFLDRLGLIFERSKRDGELSAAVLFLDIDHFKMVNDSLGHVTGDQLLIEVAHRLESCLRPGDTVARFGGDEFAILADQIHGEEDATRIATRIQEELSKAFCLNEQNFYSSASIGIVFNTSQYRSVEDLLRDADTAMYSAKYNGRARFEIFDNRMRERTIARLQLESDLRRALENQEFRLYYQPIVSLAERRVMGVEALIRWQHPTRGLLIPEDFIQSAEETGLILPIGEWVLRAACTQMSSWHKAGLDHLHISVNLSGCQFRDKEFREKVHNTLHETELLPRFLDLEVTESVAMQDVDSTIQVLKDFSRMGVRISIDDFGSGYSSLDHLKRFPVDILKIDRSFIHDMGQSDTAIVEAMIKLAHQLHLKVIAEGVELEEQVTRLQEMDCDRVQGFLFGKPMPPELLIPNLVRTGKLRSLPILPPGMDEKP